MPKKIVAKSNPVLTTTLSAKLLGEAISARRTQSDLRLEDGAALCGIAKQTLSNIEHGSDSVKLHTVFKVCHGLGIELNIKPWDRYEKEDVWK